MNDCLGNVVYISLLCYPKIVAKIEICGLHTKRWNEQPHPKRYVKRETHISVLPAKSWPVQSGSNPGHPICKHRWLGLLWEVKPGNFGPNKSPFIRTFSHMPFFEMRFHHGMRLPSLLNIVQALTKAPRISHTYSLRSHTARRSIDEDAYFCFLFFSFFSLAHWNAIVCVFWTLSGENSTFPIFQRIHIPEFLTKNAKKIARRVWGRKLYASFVYDSDGDTRLLPWSAKESKYARLPLPMC